jgi:hypothetical protein
MEVIRRSAAEIEKGELSVLVLNEAEVKSLLDPLQLLDALADAFRDLSQGLINIQAPERPEITIPHRGFSVAMPAWKAGMNIAVKVVKNLKGTSTSTFPATLRRSTSLTLRPVPQSALWMAPTSLQSVLLLQPCCRYES